MDDGEGEPKEGRKSEGRRGGAQQEEEEPKSGRTSPRRPRGRHVPTEDPPSPARVLTMVKARTVLFFFVVDGGESPRITVHPFLTPNGRQLQCGRRRTYSMAGGSSSRRTWAVASCATLVLASLALLGWGERLVRPLAGAAGGLFGAGAALWLTQLVSPEPACAARLAIAAAAAVVLALLALCLLKTGLFLLGAASLGTLAHYAYIALPDGVLPADPFVLFDVSGWHYIVVGAGGVVGAAASLLQRRAFVRIASSVLGGGGLALATQLGLSASGRVVPPPGRGARRRGRRGC